MTTYHKTARERVSPVVKNQTPLKPCAKCRRILTRETYCPDCAEKKAKQYQNQRNKEWQHLYGSRWQRARLKFLKLNPLCAECLAHGVTNRATVVDHMQAHKGDLKLFWDTNNWQSLCVTHHNKKTAKEGAWGNERKRR